MAANLDFYFFYGSNHSYLSVMRIGPLAAAARVEVRWRPFNLREILIEQNNAGFVKNEVKMNYFWRDIERRAARHNIPFAGRVPHPVDPELLALRVGLMAAQEGWCPEYSRARNVSRLVHKPSRARRRRSRRARAGFARKTDGADYCTRQES
jgi:2-hydroxychromene-2-carboxylate isomerase